jgi:acetoin utilization deacetylase AcuC-like enzyme
MSDVLCTLVDSPAHIKTDHPEHPDRFKYIRDWVKKPPYETINFIRHTPATLDDVLQVHTSEMVLSLQIACQMGLCEIEPSPTFVTEKSCESMLEAAGGVLTLLRHILDRKAQKGFAIVRPPGHHATQEKPLGFCLINNTAIAVANALKNGFERIAIIDFDGHHGNGTEEIFFEDDRVGIFSMHQEGIFPGSGLMDTQVKGRILNLPLLEKTGDPAFELIYREILLPWFKKFRPEIIFVSAGFDGHFADPITGLGFSTPGYYQFAQHLNSLADKFCDGRLLYVLEGGYEPMCLRDNVQAVLCAMAGESLYPNTYGFSTLPSTPVEHLVKLLSAMHGL